MEQSPKLNETEGTNEQVSDANEPVSDANEPVSDANEPVSDASGDDIFDNLNKVFMQGQMANMEAMARFLTHEDKNLCSALVDIRLAIDTNSRCLLKLHDLLEKTLKVGP